MKQEHRRTLPRFFSLVGVPTVATGLLWYLTAHQITLLTGCLAFMLGFIPWFAFLRWREGGRAGFPLVVVVCFSYWIYFAVSLFVGEWKIPRFYERDTEISREIIFQSMLLVTLGVAAMWSGAMLGLGRRLVPRRAPTLIVTPASLNYVRLLFALTTLLGMSDGAPYAFGVSARQIVVTLLTFVPAIGLAILFRLHLRGQSTSIDRLLIVAYVSLSVLKGLSSGWLGACATLAVVCVAIYISENKRVPRAALIGLIVYILFFQPGKAAFREQYWYGTADSIGSAEPQREASRVERVQAWFDASVDAWSDALSDTSGGRAGRLIALSQSRMSLLPQTANVVELTPAVVPYQYGATYSYLLAALIPRALWPDKPSMNEANQFYQVNYFVTREEDLDGVSIAVGILTEGYINYGWLGTIVVMLLFGVILDYIQQTFLAKTSGLFMWGIGIALIPNFLSPEAQAAALFGDLVQRIVFAILIFLPVVSFRRNPALANMAWPSASDSERGGDRSKDGIGRALSRTRLLGGP